MHSHAESSQQPPWWPSLTGTPPGPTSPSPPRPPALPLPVTPPHLLSLLGCEMEKSRPPRWVLICFSGFFQSAHPSQFPAAHHPRLSAVTPSCSPETRRLLEPLSCVKFTGGRSPAINHPPGLLPNLGSWGQKPPSKGPLSGTFAAAGQPSARAPQACPQTPPPRLRLRVPT